MLTLIRQGIGETADSRGGRHPHRRPDDAAVGRGLKADDANVVDAAGINHAWGVDPTPL
jgi:hypothetical protein